MELLIIVILILLGITAILFKLFFSKKSDEFEKKFERAHRENFINRFHYDGFDLSHHND